MSVSKSSSFPNLCFLHFSAFSMREGKQWMCCCQGILIKSPDLDQHFVCFLRYLDHPWSKLGRNHVLGKNGGSGFRCFCQDQYFSSMFIYKLFNLPWHIHGGKGRLSLSADVNWQFMGWRGKDQGPGETSRRRMGGLSSVYFLCLGFQPYRLTSLCLAFI